MSNKVLEKVISFATEHTKQTVISFAVEHTKQMAISFEPDAIGDPSLISSINLNPPFNIDSNMCSLENKISTELSYTVNKDEQKGLMKKSNTNFKVKQNRAIYIDTTYHTKPRTFYSDINGTYVELYHKDFTKEVIKICNFSISVICILIIDNGTKKSTSYKIKCSLNDIGKEKIIEVTMYDLKTKENFLNKVGGEFTFIAEENAYEYFREYISELIKKAPEDIIYNHIGWRKFDNKWAYLIGNYCIGLNFKINGAKDKLLKIDNNLTATDSAQLILNMLNISNKLSITLPMLLYSLLGLMKSLFIEAKAMPRFILWIYGVTGSMKTSISKCFFSIFNNCGDISATFKYTKAALEIKSSEYADSCLLVDDYHPVMTKMEKADMDSKASMLLRIYGDEASTGRGTKNMQKIIEVTSKGLCVITGENKFGSKSDLARLITVEISKDDINPTILSYYQNNPKVFPTHVYYFLNWVAINAESIIALIQNRVNALRAENKDLFSHKRYIDSYILLCITAEILLNYYSAIGLNLDINNIYREWSGVLREMIQVQDTNTIQQDPGIMFISALNNMIISNMCYLEDINEESASKTNMIGYKDHEYMYLHAELAYEKVCKYWRGQGVEYPLTKDSALEALERINVLIAKDEGINHRRTIKCTINGVRMRCAKLSINEIGRLLIDI